MVLSCSLTHFKQQQKFNFHACTNAKRASCCKFHRATMLIDLTNLTTVAFLKKCKHSYSIKYNLCLSTLSTDQ